MLDSKKPHQQGPVVVITAPLTELLVEFGGEVERVAGEVKCVTHYLGIDLDRVSISVVVERDVGGMDCSSVGFDSM